MVDLVDLMVEWLRLDTPSNPVKALIGQRVYGWVLPERVAPQKGPAIVVSVDSGAGHAEIDPLGEYRVQIRVWAGRTEMKDAQTVYRAVYRWIHGKTMKNFGASGQIKSCLEAVTGQPVIDPDTKLATVMAFYNVWAADVTVGAFDPPIDSINVIDGNSEED